MVLRLLLAIFLLIELIDKKTLTLSALFYREAE